MSRLDGQNGSVLQDQDGQRYDEVVATLSLLAPGAAGQAILLGVRSEYSAAHKDVMSLPTLRLPRTVAEPVLVRRDVYRRWAEMEAHKHSEHLLVFACRSIMALKLGLADWVVEEHFNYRCRLGSVLIGNTAIDEGVDPPLIQKIAMLNIICELPVMPSVPPRTAGYSSLKWIDVPSFLAAVRLRDASVASREWDCISVCVRGLCIEVGARDLATEGMTAREVT